MATNDASISNVRFNQVTQLLEYALGGTWVTVPGAGASVAGPNQSVQFNNAGAMAGSSDFVHDSTIHSVSLLGTLANTAVLNLNNPGVNGAILSFGHTDTDPFGQISGDEDGSLHISCNDHLHIETNVNNDPAVWEFTVDGIINLHNITTAERDASVEKLEGGLCYNVTTKKLNFWDGAVWRVVTSV